MTLPNPSHFNTAAQIAIAALIAAHGASNAQGLASSAAFCADTYALADVASGSKINFMPNDAVPNDAHLKHSWPIKPADKTTLWHLGSRVLTQLPADWDLSTPAQRQLLIVRSKPIQPRVGQLIEIIGTAQIETDARAPDVAVTITSAIKEITATDRLAPLACMTESIVPRNTDFAVAVNAAQANVRPKVIGFLDEFTMAGRDAIVVVDKGVLDAVWVGQKWQFIDELPHQPASVKAFGHARVLASFAHVAVLKIEHLQHEVSLNSLLRRTP